MFKVSCKVESNKNKEYFSKITIRKKVFIYERQAEIRHDSRFSGYYIFRKLNLELTLCVALK